MYNMDEEDERQPQPQGEYHPCPELNSDALLELAKYLNKSELKNYRLVSKSWQDAVTPRFRKEYKVTPFKQLFENRKFGQFATTVENSRVTFLNSIEFEAIHLDSIRFQRFIQKIGKYIKQITVCGPLNLEIFLVDTFREMLLNLTNLRELYIDDRSIGYSVQEYDPISILFPEPTQLPKLEVLKFMIYEYSGLTKDFIEDILTATINLKTFSIEYGGEKFSSSFIIIQSRPDIIDVVSSLQTTRRFLNLDHLFIKRAPVSTLKSLIEMSEAGMKLKTLKMTIKRIDFRDVSWRTPPVVQLLQQLLFLQRNSLKSLELYSCYASLLNGEDKLIFQFQFPSLPALEHLSIGRGQYGFIPEPFSFAKTFPSLTEYKWITDISSNQFYLPHWFSTALNVTTCPNLQILIIPISVTTPDFIQELATTFPNVISVHMSCANELLGVVVELWPNLSTLKLEFPSDYAEADLIDITYEDFKEVQDDLNDKFDPDSIEMGNLSPLLDLKNLKNLYLKNNYINKITDVTGYGCLAKMDSLRSLTLSKKEGLSDDCYDYIKKKQPYLTINYNWLIDEDEELIRND